MLPAVRALRCGAAQAAAVSNALARHLSAAAPAAAAAKPAAARAAAPPSSASLAGGADAGAGAAAPAPQPAHVGQFGQRFEVGRLEAVRRDVAGKRNAQWARMHGLIPGLIYGTGARGASEVVRIFVKEADLRAEVNRRKDTFLNTLFDVVVDGVPHRVVARDFQLHPFRPKIICCNWARYRPGRFPGVRMDIPLRPVNEERCLAYKEGGWLLELIHKLPVYAYGDEVPDFLFMDLRGKRMGEKIMASEIQLPEGLALRIRDQDFAVAKFVGSKRGAADAAAAAPAADAKAAGDKAAAPAAAKKE